MSGRLVCFVATGKFHISLIQGVQSLQPLWKDAITSTWTQSSRRHFLWYLGDCGPPQGSVCSGSHHSRGPKETLQVKLFASKKTKLMKMISRGSGREEWLKSLTCRNSRTGIWILAPAFTSCETLGRLCNPSPFIPTYSVNNNMQSIKWLWALNVHNPGKMPAHSRCSSPPLSQMLWRWQSWVTSRICSNSFKLRILYLT